MKFELNGVEVAPIDLLVIGLVSDFTNRPDQLKIDTDRVTLPREGLEIVQSWINTNGIFQGIPAKVTTADGTQIEYYADLYDPSNKPVFSTYAVELKLKRRYGNENFFDRAKGLTFDLMAKNGVQFNTFEIPYVIIKDNSVEMALSLGIAIYSMTRELIDQAVELVQTIKDIIDATTPNTGAPSLDTGDIIGLYIQAVFQVVFIGLLLVAIIKLAQQFFELIFPKIRYFNACKVSDLMLKGCQYLGFDFESDLLASISGLTILPVPIQKDKKGIWQYLQNDLNFSFTKGWPSTQDSTPYLGSLFDAMEKTFNGRTWVRNGAVRFERRDYLQNISQNLIKIALNNQSERTESYTYNTEECWKRYYPHYQTDFTDLHTIDDFEATDAEFSTEALNIVNADLVTIQGLDEVNIPFSMGVRKNELNWLEKLAKSFFSVVDDITGALAGGTNFEAQIDARKGVLQISQQFYANSKLLYTISGRQPENFKDIIGAPALYQNYHSINEITQNGYKIFEGVPIAISPNEFVNLLDNNFAEIDGLICEILNIKYFDEQSSGEISFKQPFDYATGKVEIITINE